MKYSKKSIDYLKELKEKDITWKTIVQKWNKKFGEKLGEKSYSALEKTYRMYKDIELEDEDARTPHPYSEFTRDAIGEIIKHQNVKEGIYIVTAAGPTTELSQTELKQTTKKRYEYALLRNKQLKKEVLKVEEINGKYYEEIRNNVFVPGFKSVLQYCKKRNAELLILPMRAHVKALQDQPNYFDPILEPYTENFVTEFKFNEYLMAFDAQLNPQQANPLTGLDRIGRKRSNNPNTSLIVAHTKQNYEPRASGNSTKPRTLYSTGTITLPEYHKNRVGRIAQEDHEMGALIVEVKNNKFFIRPIQFDEEGTFVDLGTRYYPTGKTKKERAEFVNVGDEHATHTTPELRATLHEILRELNPKAIGRHDVFDGSSVNPHMKDNPYAQATLPEEFKSLEKELVITKEIIEDVKPHIAKDCKIVMIDSNHNDFLDRYLKAGRYIQDKVNYDIAHRMIVMKLDGKNPLQEHLDPNKELIWTGPNDDFYVEGINIIHGHSGPDGARGSNLNLERTYGNVMKAHDHRVLKRYGLVSTGHFSADRHGYNKGASTWLPGVGVIYTGGQIQTITVIDGEWRI